MFALNTVVARQIRALGDREVAGMVGTASAGKMHRPGKTCTNLAKLAVGR